MEKLRYYKRQLELYKKIFDLTVEEKEAIHKENYRKLSMLLERKKEIMNNLKKMKDNFSPSSNLSPQIQSLIDKIRLIIRDTIAQEEKNQLVLKEKMQKVCGALNNIERTHVLRKTYINMPDVQGPFFINQKK